MKNIPLCIPNFYEKDAQAVKSAVVDGYVSTAGPTVSFFENVFSRYFYETESCAAAMNSGTSSVHLALRIVGVKPGDEVAVSTLSFVATSNAIHYCGAVPAFIDVGQNSWQMRLSSLENYLANSERTKAGLINKNTGRRIAAILPVHILGATCNMTEIMKLAEKYDIPVVEDACEALGASYVRQGMYVSAGSLGTVSCFSFNGNKVITSGSGGMLISNNADLVKKARHLSTQARIREAPECHDEIGFNCRMSNLQAVLGLSQFDMLDRHVQKKKKIDKKYRHYLSGGFEFQENKYCKSSFWLSAIRCDPQIHGFDAKSAKRYLAEHGIETRVIWQPLHRSLANRDKCYYVDCSVAEKLSREILCLPSSVGLTAEDQDYVISKVIEMVKSYGKC